MLHCTLLLHSRSVRTWGWWLVQDRYSFQSSKFKVYLVQCTVYSVLECIVYQTPVQFSIFKKPGSHDFICRHQACNSVRKRKADYRHCRGREVNVDSPGMAHGSWLMAQGIPVSLLTFDRRCSLVFGVPRYARPCAACCSQA